MSLFSHISHINLYSKNPQAMIYFYRDMLGMSSLDGQSIHDNWFGFHAGNSLRFAIEPESNRNSHSAFSYNKTNPVLIQFAAHTIEEFDQMNRHLKHHKTPLLREAQHTSYGLITNFTDPDGNLLEILYEQDEHK